MRPVLRPLALLAAIVTSAALLVPAAHASGDVPSRAGATKPPVGKCYDLTYRQIGHVTTTARAVPCSSRHTTVTAGVPNLPHGIGYDSKKANDAATRVCLAPAAKRTGGSLADREQTAYSLAFFFPTKAQQRAGARWVRCDVDLLGNNGVQPLPTNAKPLLRSGITTSVRRCSKGTGPYSTCNHAHTYRSVYAFTVGKQSYPGSSRAEKIAQAHCPQHTGQSYHFYFTPKVSWNAGYRVFSCLKRSRH